ncbi:hypothetical protein FPV67DRAFT_1455409 [Lyophyllum atratum]|nr:hypothetical protein FPV67DRAFT_1455409 [Lyophyllum atratum]
MFNYNEPTFLVTFCMPDSATSGLTKIIQFAGETRGGRGHDVTGDGELVNDVGLGQEPHPRNEVFDFVLRDDCHAVPVSVEVTSSLTAQVSIETAFVSNVVTLKIQSAVGTVVHVVDLHSHGVCLEVENTFRSLKVVARLFPVG